MKDVSGSKRLNEAEQLARYDRNTYDVTSVEIWLYALALTILGFNALVYFLKVIELSTDVPSHELESHENILSICDAFAYSLPLALVLFIGTFAYTLYRSIKRRDLIKRRIQEEELYYRVYLENKKKRDILIDAYTGDEG